MSQIMDTKMFIEVLLLGFVSVHCVQSLSEAVDQCIQDLVRNEEFIRCARSFSIIADEMQQPGAALSGNEMAVYRAMCSPEGKAGLKCMMDFIFECPEVEAQMEKRGAFHFKEIMKQGGVDIFCEIVLTPDCRTKLVSCADKINRTEGMGYRITGLGMNPEMGPTPYNTIPMQMTLTCGPMHDGMLCALDAMEECPKTASFTEQLVQKMSEMEGQKGDPALPSYAELKSYMLVSCPGLPQDFKEKQQCMSMSMAKPEFLECYQKVTGTKTTHCDVYFGGKECVMKYVGNDCGETYAKAVAAASPLFSKDIPSDCEKQLNGVSNLQASVLTMISTEILLIGRL